MAPHDPLFKRLLQRFFIDFLRLVAPDVAARLDLSTLVFLDKEFSLPDLPGSRVVDLLARIPLLGDGGRTLLVHVEIYLSRPEPLAWALAALMNPAPHSRARLKFDCLLRVNGASLDDEGSGQLANCIESYVQLSPEEVKELASLGSFKDRRTQIVSTSLFTWTDRVEIEGEKKGMRRVLLALLQARFGSVPDDVRQRVEKIRSEDRLTRLAERVLTARSLKEMRLG